VVHKGKIVAVGPEDDVQVPNQATVRDLAGIPFPGITYPEVQRLALVTVPESVTVHENGDIDVGLLFTGSSVIPKDAVLLRDDKGLQPADNPVFLLRKDKATPATLAIVNAVSAKLTTAAYNKMSLDIENNKLDPAVVAKAFLKKNNVAYDAKYLWG